MTATPRMPEDVARLTELVAAERDAKQRDRYRAALLAVEGHVDPARELDREQIAATLSRSRQFVDEWVGRYRDGGVDALRPKRQPGRARRLDAGQERLLCEQLDAGPDEASGRSAFTGRDVQTLVETRFGKAYSLNGAYKLMHRLGYSWLMPRPRHPKADAAAEEAFKKKRSTNSPA
jgi:transposase